jgi:CysZ protein
MPEPVASKVRPGFLAGVRALTGGAAFVVSTPRMWGYAAVPLVIFAAHAIGLGWAGVALAARCAEAIVGSSAATMAVIGRGIIGAVLIVTALLAAVIVAFSVAQPLSGWALDTIVCAQERALGAPEWAPQPRLASFVRALAVAALAVAVGFPLIAALTFLGILFPAAAVVTFPLKLVVSAWLVAWDLLDYPFSQRGLGLRARLRWLAAHARAAFGFGLAAAVLLVVPGVGLMLLPIGVAGGARLLVATERAET